MTIYNCHNSLGANVYDVDRVERLALVISVDTGTGEVVCAYFPVRTDGNRVATFTLKFRSIYPISGGSPWPCLFHCYGRIA